MSAFDPKRTFGPEDCCHKMTIGTHSAGRMGIPASTFLLNSLVRLPATLNNMAEQGRYADAEPLYKRAPASTPKQKGSTLSS